MPTLKLRVKGMESREDEDRVQRILLGEPGVYGAVADHEASCVEVDFEDDEESVQELVALLATNGFEAELAG